MQTSISQFNLWVLTQLLSVCLLSLNACQQKEHIKPKELSESIEGNARAAACAPRAGWSELDLDYGAVPLELGVPIPFYNGEMGYTRYNFPLKYQANARYKYQGNTMCYYDYDNRLYFTDPYIANPKNKKGLRLRYNTPWPWYCKTPYGDYLTAKAGNKLGLKTGTPYLRVTVGENCYTSTDFNTFNVYLVAP